MTIRRSNSLRYSDLVAMIDGLRAQEAGSAVALVLGKLDGLNSLHTRFGYAVGDKVIHEFYKKLEGIVREHDIAVEISSSTFAMIIHAPLHEGHVMLAADKIGRLAEGWIQVSDTRLRLDVSMGCAIIDNPRDSAELLLRNAEIALYKCQKTDQHAVFYDEAEDETLGTSSHPMFDAHRAIENGEFRVHYQPQFDLRSNELVGAEALVRWSGPDGLVAPGSFMNELERSRALMPLLQFVMNSSSREMSRWVRRMPGLNVSVNSSATDLEDANLAEIMREVLGMWNLSPEHLTLEITETSLMTNPEVGIETLNKLREMGVRTSIDDFGTGYSSLALLKELPVDELKIDQSFVSRMIECSKHRKLVQSIIDMGHALDLIVVAEGVETEGVTHMLRDAGCDIAQGYFYSKPLTGAEFERGWLVDPSEISAESN
jgi:diguanylate cyclase (GGDEF)-like protein